ncbi:MAG: T9SS type A sorting domain-containing protein [Bacteroidota bacterium]
MHQNDPAINLLEIYLPETVEWSSIRPDLAVGWRIYPLLEGNGFQLLLVGSDNDTLQFPQTAMAILSACFEPPQLTEEFSLTLLWKNDGILRAAEQVNLSCGQCTDIFEVTAICQDSSGYSLQFQFVNSSIYPMDEIRLMETESQGVLLNLSLPLAQRLLPGDTSEMVSLSLDTLAETYSQLCFYLIGSRTEGQFRLDCCSSLQCIDLPLCDRCCTEFEEFEDAALAGFDIILRNETPELLCLDQQILTTARELGECDLAKYTLRNLDDELVEPATQLVSGRDTAVFGAPILPGNYEICMSASRRNLSGSSCFSISEIQICDTVLVDFCVGTNYLEAADFWMIYPNPTDGTFYLEGENPILGYQLLDSFGRLLITESIRASINHQFDFNDLPAGLYLLLIFDDGPQPYHQRILIL